MSKIRMVIPRQNSPITAIRKKCLDCCCGGRKEVAECNLYHCPLFPYRFGMGPETYVASKSEDEIIIVNEKGKVLKNESKKGKSKVLQCEKPK